MKKLFQREWSELEVPEKHLRQARDRAWRRISGAGSSSGGPRWAVPPAIAAAILLAWWLIPTDASLQSPKPASERVASAPKRQLADRLASDEAAKPVLAAPEPAPLPAIPRPESGPGPERELAVAAARPGTNAESARTEPLGGRDGAQTGAAATPERLVINFLLPESGVRMIWVKEAEFHFGGEE